jgi:hypothetical protein
MDEDVNPFEPVISRRELLTPALADGNTDS